jgi:hypothetical protein
MPRDTQAVAAGPPTYISPNQLARRVRVAVYGGSNRPRQWLYPVRAGRGEEWDRAVSHGGGDSI